MNAKGQDAIVHSLPRHDLADSLHPFTSAGDQFISPRPLVESAGYVHQIASPVGRVEDLWSLMEPYLLRGFHERWVKPAFDRVIGLILLLIALPITLFAALALRSQVGEGPLLLPQERVGLNGRTFTMYKLRTMRPDRRRRQLPFDGPDRRTTHKTTADPRHTPRGMLIRKLSIDELPQLWNVVKGDMSLVGPRPELAALVDRGGLRTHPRHRIKPGLTGPWQISPDRNYPITDHLERDLAYAVRITFWGDLTILARTAMAVVRGRGS